MQHKIVVIGSSNTDMVVKTKNFPKPGETVLGGTFLMNLGGKGANQAVAAARLGAEVIFITKVGRDLFGASAINSFKNDNIDTQHIIETTDLPSGVALITINEKGENNIVVASGANMALSDAEISDEILKKAKIVLMQLEIPIETVENVKKRCVKMGVKVVLNPAPATKLSDELLKDLFLITPNETETYTITGIFPKNKITLSNAAHFLHEKGVQNVIITLGSQGVFLSNAQFSEIIPAREVAVIDTTAAGDVFNGALVNALCEDVNWREACHFACKAAAISVTRMGAQTSAPYRNEIG